MPRAYRPMKAEGDEPRPVIGDSASKLGVRERDLAPDERGNAEPGKGGVSVVSSLAGLRRRVTSGKFPAKMVPARLNDLGKIPGATGSNSLHLFRIGEGSFETGHISAKLFLMPDEDDHGTIQPAFVMPYNEYKQAIADTRKMWVSGECDDSDDE